MEAEAEATAHPARSFARFGACGAVVLGIVTLTWPTWAHMVQSWLGPSGHSQGLLVVPLALWLAWRALAVEPAPAAEPAWWALLLTGAASFTWLFFRAATVSVLEQTAATVLIWIAATSVLGWRCGRALLFPVGYVFVGIPVWDVLLPVLQPLTTTAAGFISGLLGIPTYLEGNLVHIPSGVFEIEAGCAGLRYLVSAIAIAALYAHLEFRRWSSWLSLMGLAGLLSVIGNWIRVVIVIRAGHVSGMHHPWVKDHANVGWVIFAITLVPLFAYGRRLEASERAAADAKPASPPEPTRPPKRLAAACVATIATGALPLAVSIARGVTASAIAPQPLLPPQNVQGWNGPLAADGDWQPASSPVDSQFLVAYDDQTTRVTVFHAFYATQAQGHEVIGYDNRIQGHDWTLATEDLLNDSELGEWRRAVLTRRDARQRVVVYRYTVGGRLTASRIEAKVRQGLGAFTSDRSATILAASAPCGASCEDASASALRLFRATFSP